MSEHTTRRDAAEGFAVFLDAMDAGLPATRYAEFQVRGGSTRLAYRTGYVFDRGGPYFVRVGATEFAVRVTPYVPARTVAVTRGMSQAQVAALLTAGADLVWGEGAETTLTGPLVIPPAARNVRFVDARFHVNPPPGRRAGIYVAAEGFRCDGARFRGPASHAGNAMFGKPFDVCAFVVQAGGSLVTRRAAATRMNTFVRTESGHRGVVAEAFDLRDHLAYALYANGGDAGVSMWRGRVEGPGNEPWFRVINNPANPGRVANLYVGQCEMRRLATPPIGKDGITPRDCRRFSADANVLHRCQLRSGQDDQGVADGGSDPEDVLFHANVVHGGYLDHKRGRGTARRIHVIANTFHAPYTRPPVMFEGTTDSTVSGNVWVGGEASWRPQKWEKNAGLTVRGNGNSPAATPPAPPLPSPTPSSPPADPLAALRARLAAIDAELPSVVARLAAGRQSVADAKAKLEAATESVAGLERAQDALMAERRTIQQRLSPDASAA